MAIFLATSYFIGFGVIFCTRGFWFSVLWFCNVIDSQSLFSPGSFYPITCVSILFYDDASCPIYKAMLAGQCSSIPHICWLISKTDTYFLAYMSNRLKTVWATLFSSVHCSLPSIFSHYVRKTRGCKKNVIQLFLALFKWVYLKKRALHAIQFFLLASKMHIKWIISHGFSPMDLRHHTPPLL